VGKVYVLLLDPDTRETMAQTETTAAADYAWAFPDPIPVGRYILIAGTDRDNDGFIGDAGEAIGVHPSISEPAPLDVTSAGVHVTLPVGERVTIGASGAPGAVPAEGFRRLVPQPR
jgi:serine protease